MIFKKFTLLTQESSSQKESTKNIIDIFRTHEYNHSCSYLILKLGHAINQLRYLKHVLEFWLISFIRLMLLHVLNIRDLKG